MIDLKNIKIWLLSLCLFLGANLEAETLRGNIGYYDETINLYGQTFMSGYSSFFEMQVENKKITSINSPSIKIPSPAHSYYNSKNNFAAYYDNGEIKTIPNLDSYQFVGIANWKDNRPFGNSKESYLTGYITVGSSPIIDWTQRSAEGISFYQGIVFASTIELAGAYQPKPKKQIQGSISFYMDWQTGKLSQIEIDFPNVKHISYKTTNPNRLRATFYGPDAEESGGTFYIEISPSYHVTGAFIGLKAS